MQINGGIGAGYRMVAIAHQVATTLNTRRDGASATSAPAIDAHPEQARRAGLTSAEAKDRLQRDGPNLLPQPERRRRWRIVIDVLREPMLLLLLAAMAVYMVLGDLQEALLLGVSVLLVIWLTVYQEQKSERALQALRELGTPRARALRDGEPCILSSSDLVVGDVILLAEGERVPADARVLDETDLHADESLLTGESVPVRRAVAPASAEDTLLHASTLVVRGHGTAEVVAVGSRTAVGQIGVALRSIHPEPTPMQHEIRRVVAMFALLSLASCVLVAGLYLATRGGWLDAILAGLTLAMATIPEEFPVVLAVFLALGAWRMAQHKALVRRTPAIEALGATTVLCTDKTGTLTENRMAVAALVVDDERADLASIQTPTLRMLLETAALASQPQSHDPMDRALQDVAQRLDETRAIRQHVREYPLSPACPAVVHAWALPGDALLVACKGAPETVADLCRLPDIRRNSVLAEVDAMARKGLRVLAVASAT